MMIDRQARILANWQQVLTEVRDALHAHGRSDDEATVVGVTKYVDAETTQMLVDAGCTNLGENRPQVLWQKAESGLLDDQIQWHMIGHLQRNKVRRLLRFTPIIHSVDSQRLLTAIASEAEQRDEIASILLEVNISGDENKTGMSEVELSKCLIAAESLSVQIRGLMAMAGFGTSGDEARKQFAKVRELRDRLVKETGNPLPELSMGMSADFREAIAEAATMIRIGSRLFEGIEY